MTHKTLKTVIQELLRNKVSGDIFQRSAKTIEILVKNQTNKYLSNRKSDSFNLRMVDKNRVAHYGFNHWDVTLLGPRIQRIKAMLPLQKPQPGFLFPSRVITGRPIPGLKELKTTELRHHAELNARSLQESDSNRGIKFYNYRLFQTTIHRFLQNTNGLEGDDTHVLLGHSIDWRTLDGGAASGHITWWSPNIELDIALLQKNRFAGLDDHPAGASKRFGKLSGTRPVVLGPHATSQLLKIILNELSGQCVNTGTSIFSEKLGETITSVPLTVTVNQHDFPIGAGIGWDDEGSPVQTNTLFSNGRIVGVYDDLRSAASANRTAGNCVRDHSGYPQPGYLNARMSPGKSSLDTLLSFPGTGAYVGSLLSPKLDRTTGQLTARYFGRLVSSGNSGPILSQGMISGNIFTLLQQIDGIGQTVLTDQRIQAPPIRLQAATLY